MKKTVLFLFFILLLTTSGIANSQEYRIDKRNERTFQKLFDHLITAYEKPSSVDEERIDADLTAIRDMCLSDFEVAESIADHWRRVYLDSHYKLALWSEGESVASELSEMGIPDSETHAFVVLGYALKNGEMTAELQGRCDAAAAAANAFPHTILVCSGGATGGNNPKQHTEAGEMKAYLVQQYGIDTTRIFIDEHAMSTLENAVNTFTILREQGVHTITIVTSSYHQRWGQVLYNAMAALCQQEYGHSIAIVGNYSYAIEPSNERYRRDDRIAIQQLSTMLSLPK